MKVILKADIERLGKVGEVVTVAAGYARNFLMPRELAFEATEKNLARVEVDKKRYLKVQAKVRTDAEALGGEARRRFRSRSVSPRARATNSSGP